MKNYTFEDAYDSCLEYFNGDELATSVIVNKYLLRDSEENFKEIHPKQLWKRLTKEFLRIENKYPNSLSEKEIYEAFADFKHIIPQGSPMTGIGNEYQVTSLGNCFVVGQPYDSYGGILYKDQELAQIMKRRGGVGIDISSIRPMGANVNNAARTSDGIRAFMDRYSNTTKEVAQNGRRGALMISIDCRHPDVMTFINVKKDKNRVTGANISVKWHDDFMKAVETGEKYILRYPVDVPLDKAKVTREVDAREIWNSFVEGNWDSAEPGCLFWDKITNQSISDCYQDVGYKTVTTNPCGEITLSEYGACILMAINLTGFIDMPYQGGAFNMLKFEKYIRMGVRLIDDMIDLEIEKIEKIIKKVENDPEPEEIKVIELNLWKKVIKSYRETRRVGLGITGLGDMLAMLGFKYGTEKANEEVEWLFRKFQEICYDESATLAQERGAFPIWDWNREKDCHYIKQLPVEVQSRIQLHGRRNIAMNTCAPAGSISILAQVTSGIEPVIWREYNRDRKLNPDEIRKGAKASRTDKDGTQWTSYKVQHHGFKKWQELNPDVKLEDSPYWGAEAGELNPIIRVRLQGIIQKYIDHSISSTVNLPEDVHIDIVKNLYMEGWKVGCKGLTIYREGSRDGVMTKKIMAPGIRDSYAPKRPPILPCDIHYSNIKGKNWILFVGMMGDRPYEIFGGQRSNIEIPKKYKTGWIKKNGLNDRGNHTYDLYVGSLEDETEQIIVKDIVIEFSADAGNWTLIISAMLRHGIPAFIINELLHKVNPDADMFCFEKSIARVLKKYVQDGEKSCTVCPECQSKNMQYQDGCKICLTCGHSACG